MLSIIKAVLIPFAITGLMYGGMEIMLDNTSHRSMVLAGGTAYTVCAAILYVFSFPYWINCLIIAIVIMILEYIFGMKYNKNYDIWDYRKYVIKIKIDEKPYNIPLHIKGQVCLQFFLVWFLAISHVIIYMYNFFLQVRW